MHEGMERSRTGAAAVAEETVGARQVRIAEECLELDVSTARERRLLRGWLRRVNGGGHAKPYLVEGPAGRFRLYVGEAAERVRTRRGIL